MKAHLISWRPIATAIAIIGCTLLIGVGLWKAKTPESVSAMRSNYDSQGIKEAYKERVRQGLGRSVSFMSPTSPPEVIGISVDQAANFIRSRSGLAMGDKTRRTLIQMEKKVSKNNSNRDVSVADLTDAVTDTIFERLMTLTDSELEAAGRTLRNSHAGVLLRATGNYMSTVEEFAAQSKSLRNQARDRSSTARSAVRAFVEEEAQIRFSLFSEALPDQFGKALEEGVTPVQGLLISYSIITDDYLDGSQDELNRLMTTLPGAPARGHRIAGRQVHAFGVRGRIFSTPATLFFNKETMDSFLKRLEKARASK